MFYLEEIGEEKLLEIFSSNEKIAFGHKGCDIAFSTDGTFIYVHPIVDNEADLESDSSKEESSFDFLFSEYEDFTRFLNTFKRIEVLLLQELHVSDEFNLADTSIRQLELKYYGSYNSTKNNRRVK